MTGLVEFLKARLDEDEKAARDASPSPWKHPDEDETDALWLTREDAYHIYRHDPAQVLAEVEAKRGAIRLYEDTLATIERLKEQGQPTAAHEVAVESYLNVLRLDAAVFASHPEYDESWSP